MPALPEMSSGTGGAGEGWFLWKAEAGSLGGGEREAGETGVGGACTNAVCRQLGDMMLERGEGGKERL